MITKVIRFWTNEHGATAVEYAVLLGLILMGAISAITAFGSSSGGLWGGIHDDLNGTPFGGGS